MTSPSYVAASAIAHIKNICQQHDVSTLLHFTRAENLISILNNGLLSRTELQIRNISATINDTERLDGYPNAVCLSISFPNYRMFYRYRVKSPTRWVVLKLEASVLWEGDCAFCSTNAASTKTRKMPLIQRKQPSALEELFSDYRDDVINVARSSLRLPESWPTNPQAEVLVFKPISPRFIKAIYVESREEAIRIKSVLPYVYSTLPILVDPFYFCPRSDYSVWQSVKQHNSLKSF